MASLVLVLLVVWTVVHGANYFLRPFKSNALLPTSHSLGRKRERSTQVVLNKFHLRVQTKAWNARHDAFTKVVSPQQGVRLRAVLTSFYSAGCVMGVLGTLLSLGLLIWNCGHTLLPLLQGIMSSPAEPLGLMKRGLELAEKQATRSSVIKPLIPGVTVPLNHLPVILFTVFLSQIIHELGHAVSAALDAVPVMSTGVSFTVIVPAAFVTFPAAALGALEPLARARIIAAGPFHNLVFWAALLLVNLGAGDLLTRTIYRDMSDVGRVVVGIDRDSYLQGHLPVGSLITKLDDTPLGAAGVDRWTEYLTSSDTSDVGWCVDRTGFLGSPQACCAPHAPASSLSCFIAVSLSSTEQGCLEAVPILTDQDGQRCTTDTDCLDAASACIRPDASAQILRITVHLDEQEHEEVVLWSGPPAEVFEQVEIGHFLPRTQFLPLWLWASIQLFWMYLKTATLSLYLFNLLPLPYLDGAQFVDALLDVVFDPDARAGFDEYDIEALEAATANDSGSRGRRRGRWKARAGRGITVATTGLFVLCALLALMNIR
ncbi:hypothetical protein DFH07DRAFT_62558 [Mycena maculata]|uniref:Endopeptidase S2P n=1 Tax=Mycena maculata TaxID=230809 RepID=A0AAD7IE02_9AGAR|nr:hypothetical protein DFH07DRAFT_62558 [Mycena maculata]